MAASPRQPPLDTPVDFVIKSTTTDAFSTKLHLSSTVGQVKEQLSRQYPGNPKPTQQTVCTAVCRVRHHTGASWLHQLPVFTAHQRGQGAQGRLYCVVQCHTSGLDCKMVSDPPGQASPQQQEYDPTVPYTLHLVIKSAHTSTPPMPHGVPRSTPMPAQPSTSSTPTPTPAPASAQPSTSNPASPEPTGVPDTMHFAAVDPAMAAAYTMYNAAFTAYQYATHTGTAPLPDHIQLASMPFIMVRVRHIDKLSFTTPHQRPGDTTPSSARAALSTTPARCTTAAGTLAGQSPHAATSRHGCSALGIPPTGGAPGTAGPP